MILFQNWSQTNFSQQPLYWELQLTAILIWCSVTQLLHFTTAKFNYIYMYLYLKAIYFIR